MRNEAIHAESIESIVVERKGGEGEGSRGRYERNDTGGMFSLLLFCIMMMMNATNRNRITF